MTKMFCDECGKVNMPGVTVCVWCLLQDMESEKAAIAREVLFERSLCNVIKLCCDNNNRITQLFRLIGILSIGVGITLTAITIIICLLVFG